MSDWMIAVARSEAMSEGCCDDMRETNAELNRLNAASPYPHPTLRSAVTFNGKQIRFCPFCGKEIIYFNGVPVWFDGGGA